MHLFRSLAIAISMYSKIPVPMVEWSEKNMKYAMCFFPVVGAVTGALQLLAGSLLLEHTSCGILFFAVVMTLIPAAVTGGIHLDGFADTVDALSSYGDREKKLQILKDPNTGAFAVIGLCAYFLASAALWSEADGGLLPVIACSYMLSRSLSGISVVSFPPAKNSGLLRTFEDLPGRSAEAPGPDSADPVGVRLRRHHALSVVEAGCGHDSGSAPCIFLLLQDEQEAVRRYDRGSGGVFPAGVRAGDAGGSSIEQGDMVR